MKRDQIKVGGHYSARVSGNYVTVRVDAIKRQSPSKFVKAETHYEVTNLATARKLVFHSAAKFRSEVGEHRAQAAIRAEKPRTTADVNRDQGREMAEAIGPVKEGEHRPDPTAPTALTPSSTQTIPPVRPTAATAAAPSGLVAALKNGSPSKPTPPHVIVTARAGTGKTTTGEEGLKTLRGLPTRITPSPQQAAVWEAMKESAGCGSVAFTAFGKDIAVEVQDRLARSGLDRLGCEGLTTHSIGFRAVRSAFKIRSGKDGVNSFVVQDYLAEELGADSRQLKKDKPVLVNAVCELVDLVKQTLTPTDHASLSQLARRFDVETASKDCNPSEVFDLVPAVLERCKNPEGRGQVDFNDMCWLPVVHGLPGKTYDLMIVDECLPGWVPIMLADGRSMTIQEIYETDLEVLVRSYDTETGLGRNCRVTARQRFLNQKSLVKVKVKHCHRSGTNKKHNFVVCTSDHKVWTINRGWVESGKLEVGDNVIVETAAATTQKGKTTKTGRDHLAKIQAGNTRGLGNKGGSPEMFNRNKGGNGKGPTLAEKTVLVALCSAFSDPDWEYNYPVPTKSRSMPGRENMPTCYKIDVAHPKLKIAIEIDGQSHRSEENKVVDAKKQKFLTENGWTVVRISNKQAVQKTEEVVDKVSQLTVGLCSNGNCPKPAKVVSVDQVEIPDDYVYDVSVEHCHNFYANGILVHNCQDLNRARQEIVKQYGRRLMLVGDDRQAIFGFAGADAESMARMAKELGGIGSQNYVTGPCPGGTVSTANGLSSVMTLPLTVTRRCGKAIVEEARKLVPDFEAHPSNPDGKINQARYTREKVNGQWRDVPVGETYLPLVADGDRVLCRVNAPLVSQYFKLIRMGRDATILGRDIATGLLKLVERFGAGTVADLVKCIEEWREVETAKEQALKNPSETRIGLIGDKAECLRDFADGAQTVQEVRDRMGNAFADKRCPRCRKGHGKDAKVCWTCKVDLVLPKGVQLSSIHRAKGLEAERVFFLKPTGTGPRVEKLQPWELEQERNLDYVGITRAISELVFVR